jgi:hypothetical protein
VIIGLCGKIGAGKDAAGDYLVKHHGFTRLSFADPLKESAAACWPGVTLDDWNKWKNDPEMVVEIKRQGSDTPHARVTCREFLKRYGTEAHRLIPEFGDDVWVDMMPPKLKEEQNYVITDARFENEIRTLRRYRAMIIYLDRPGVDVGDQHASETSVPMKLVDIILPNDGTLGDLWTRLDLLVAAPFTVTRIHTI